MIPVRDIFICTSPETAAAERMFMPTHVELVQALAAVDRSGRGNSRLFLRSA